MYLPNAEEMNVSIKAACSHDLIFACNNVRRSPDNHIWMDTVHNIRIPSFSNTRDVAVLYTDISFEDSAPVDNQRVRNNCIQTFSRRSPRGLAHSFADGLPSTKGALIAIYGVILFHFNPHIGQSQAHQISCRGTEHSRISFSFHREADDESAVSGGLWDVRETLSLEAGDNPFGSS